MNEEYLYRVDHKHVLSDYEESMHIGTSSSYENANKVIDELLIKPGFSLFPRSCFKVTKVIIDDYDWRKGFVKTEEGDRRIE